MSNMSYCRFRNTLSDLRDCEESIADMFADDNPSKDELDACRRLIAVCVSIANEWGDEA